MIIGPPPNTAVDQISPDLSGVVTPGWATFFSNAFVILSALTQSGTTAQRPVSILWVGRTFFDSTLNRPIWYTGTNWIRADGVVV